MIGRDPVTSDPGEHADAPARPAGDDKPLATLAGELAALVVAYAKQETVEPIKALGRFVAFGLAGGILLATGWVLVSVAALRAAQVETGSHLTGHWSWVPYVAGVLVAATGAALALARIGARVRR